MSRKQVDVLLEYEDKDLPTVESKDLKLDGEDAMLHAVLSKHNQWLTKVNRILNLSLDLSYRLSEVLFFLC